jgi:SAM-dependent methyltransferase
MQNPTLLTDRAALLRNRIRATTNFLHDHAILDVQERLQEVNRTFTQPVVVTGNPGPWSVFGATVPDDDILDLQPARHDLVLHAMALHWSNDPVGQLVQCRRALKPDGLFVGLMFGGQTLADLRIALAEAETAVTGGLSPRVLPMGEIRDLGALLQRAGFALPVADSFTLSIDYRDGWHLMRDLRAMGEANALVGRLRHPTQRQVLQRANDILAERSTKPNGRVTATFELICLTGWAPDESQPKPLRPGSATTRLASILGTDEKPLVPPSVGG